MQHNDYKKLSHLAKYINRLLATGKWNSLAASQKSALQNALMRLTNTVKQFIAKGKLVRVLGAAIMLVSANASAQSFADPVTGAFGMTGDLESYLSKPEFVDIDDDGDLDYFNFDGEAGFVFQENIGTATDPVFGPAETNPFDLTIVNVPLLPIFGDIDNDGDFDIMASTYEDGTPMYYENIGTATDPSFTAEVILPFGLTGVYMIVNDLVDIDDDGDLDLFVSKYDDGDGAGHVFMRENIGTPEAANFGPEIIDPLGIAIPAVDYFAHIDFADFDGDGDYDFMRTQLYGKIIYYHENVGDVDAPEFDPGSGLVSPYDLDPLTDDQYFAALSVVDIDADGDYDIFAGEYYSGAVLFYENRTIVAGVEEETDLNAELAVYPNPAIDQINLKTNLAADANATVSVLTLEGKVIYYSASMVNTIDVANFPAGIYLIELTTEANQVTRVKFVKE
jgi:hypothetical protein